MFCFWNLVNSHLTPLKKIREEIKIVQAAAALVSTVRFQGAHSVSERLESNGFSSIFHWFISFMSLKCKPVHWSWPRRWMLSCWMPHWQAANRDAPTRSLPLWAAPRNVLCDPFRDRSDAARGIYTRWQLCFVTSKGAGGVWAELSDSDQPASGALHVADKPLSFYLRKKGKKNNPLLGKMIFLMERSRKTFFFYGRVAEEQIVPYREDAVDITSLWRWPESDFSTKAVQQTLNTPMFSHCLYFLQSIPSRNQWAFGQKQRSTLH